MSSRKVSEETALIISTIQESNANLSKDIATIRNELTSLSREMILIKNEMVSMKDSVQTIECRQYDLETRVDNIEGRINHCNEAYDSLHDELYAMSYENDVLNDKINQLGKQMEMLQMDKLKNSLRIFGIAEHKDENLMVEIQDKVLSVIDDAENDKLNKTISYAKRVGNNTDQDRMIIAKFDDYNTKMKLFQYRNELRSKGIRISNDLTYNQRQELKKWNSRGYKGYYVNGVLHKDKKPEIIESGKSRVFKRASRKNDEHTNYQQMEVQSQSTVINDIDQ
ncbi:hypothetical protein ACF0H5_023687 [Mactra antiquata]